MQNNIIKNESILEVFKRNYLNHKTELENLKGDFTDLFFIFTYFSCETISEIRSIIILIVQKPFS